MPLASRINTEPRKKRAKRSPPSTSALTNAAVVASSADEEKESVNNDSESSNTSKTTKLNTKNNKKSTANNNDHSTTSSTENDESLANTINNTNNTATTVTVTKNKKTIITKSAANKNDNKNPISAVTNSTVETTSITIKNENGVQENNTAPDEKNEMIVDEEMKTDETPIKEEIKDTINNVKNNTNKNTTDKFNSTMNTTVNNLSANTSVAFGSTSIINTTTNNHNEETMMSDVTTTSVMPGNLPELSHTICLGTTKAGYCLAVGENLSNQLGLGCEIDDRKKPQMVKDLPTNIIQVAAGGMHSAVLTQDGIVYTFGCNDEFALGRSNDEDIDKVDLPEKSIEITTGDSHTAALSESGIVYAWGTFRDGSGVLGLENKKIAKTPMKFKLNKKIVKISSGADHLVFLTSTGEVFTAGNSEHGQLGRISKYNSCRGGRRGCDMILEPGLVRFAKRKELQGHRQIEDIFTTPYCTFLKVKDSDITIGFGLNNCYQLGIEDGENRYQPDLLSSLKFENGAKIKKVIGGMHHTLFLDTNGFVYSMGSHRYGCLGHGKIDADLKQPLKIPNLVDVIDIAANTNVSYAIDKHGKVFNWGTNYSKQLGQDTEDDYFVPTLLQSRNLDVRDCNSVSIGGQHALFVVSEEKDKDSDESI